MSSPHSTRLPLATRLAIGLIISSTTFHGALAQTGQTSPVSFRKPSVEMAALQPGTGASADTADLESLSEQKQTLEGEVRYAKAKLDAAQKKLTNAANDEQSAKLQQEVQDWEARMRTTQAQLAQVDQELSSTVVVDNNVLLGGPGTEIIVPGENLEIFVVEDPSFNGRYQVRRGGY
ncbi:MAG: hypothetical protein EOP84_31845, partial [Verrucomicrobiaceae bacterium]